MIGPLEQLVVCMALYNSWICHPTRRLEWPTLYAIASLYRYRMGRKLPYVVLTSDISWYPAIYDSVLTEDNTLYDAIADFTHDDISYDVFDQFGIFKPRPVNSAHITNKTELISNELHAFQMEINQQILDPSFYRNNFLQVPTETIKCTFEANEVAGHFVCFSE